MAVLAGMKKAFLLKTLAIKIFTFRGITMKNIRTDTTILSTGDAAKLLSVSVRTVTKWCDSGVLKGWKVNNHRRFHINDVIAFVKKQDMHRAEESCALHEVPEITIPGFKEEIQALKTQVSSLTKLCKIANQCLVENSRYSLTDKSYSINGELRNEFIEQLRRLGVNQND